LSAYNPGNIEDVVREFRDFLTVDLRLEKRTVKNHCNHIHQFLRSVDRGPCEVSKPDVRSYLLERMKTKTQSTVNNDLKALKRFFRDYLNKPEIVESFKFKQPEFEMKQIPSRKDVIAFYEGLPCLRHKATFLLCASSGLRINELLRLSWCDIDLENNRIYSSKHSSRTKRVGCGFFNDEANKALRELIPDAKEGERLLPSYTTIRRHWRQTSEKTGIRITPQMLREWFCSEMGRLGIPDRYIDAFCGRVPRSILARHYTDYSPEKLKRIYDKADLKVLD